MLDSLVRKFSKINKYQTNTHQNQRNSNHLSFCSSSSFSSSISSSSSCSSASNKAIDLNQNCVVLELYDFNQFNIKPEPLQISNTIPEQVEHIYEEIEENNNHMGSKSSNKIIMLREELINEILPSSTSSLFSNKSTSSSGSSSTSSSFSSKKKKSVRFNYAYGQELNKKSPETTNIPFETGQMTENVRKNDLFLCSECVNCLKQQPIIHSIHHNNPPITFNSILKKPLHDESSSTASSSSFYTTNSINSTSSMMTSAHSHTFNQLIEEFLNRATKSPSKNNTLSISNISNTLPSAFKQFQNEPSVTLGMDQSKKGSSSSCKSFVYFKNNSENSGPKNVKSVFEFNKYNTSSLPSNSNLSSNSSTTIDERLSFRVTNLTIEDLKNRQKLIELKKSNSMNVFF